jgi:glycosyltransferase involved in cell wall biosynthesis
MSNVSIILATWNRSNILGAAIESVLHQSYSDWELIVVGDCCTDDTDAVVNSYSDPRIRFINLTKNFGEQSRPNNVGVAESTGEYLAFINHDDLWFPDHLESCLELLQSREADMVFAAGCALLPGGDHFIKCAMPGEDYTPTVDVPVSTWLLKRSAFEAVGEMRPARELYSYPTHEWLVRAWRGKRKMLFNPHVSVVLIHSGFRKGSYSERHSSENEWVLDQMKSNPAFREELLEKTLLGQSRRLNSAGGAWKDGIKRIFRNTIYASIKAFGISPLAFKNVFRHGKRGGFLNKLRKIRGLDKLKE